MAERFKTPDDARRLGAKIRMVRKTKGFTLSSLSVMTGVDAGQLSKVECGKMVTLSKNVQKICIYLGIHATGGDLPLTRAGRVLDELIASMPNSEPAVARLVGAIKEVILSAGARPGSGQVE